MSSIVLRRLLTVLTLLLLGAPELGAQWLGPAPKRPKMSADADTNDAQVYHDYGLEMFERDPNASAAAFYWAARINPTMANAFYGRRMALIARNRALLRTYFTTRNRQGNKDIRAADSLYLRALMINPFLYTQLDKRMFKEYIRQRVDEASAGSGEQVGRGEIDFYIERWLNDSDIETRAWVAYSEGAFDLALSRYAEAAKSAKFKAGIRTERARIFAMRGSVDSAVAQFNLALEEMRKRDEKDLVFFYNSKAVLEHSIGALLEQVDSTSAAREAYGRALQEDLSYHPAHLRLGLMAITAKDTAAALSELELAAQIAPNEPNVRFTYGFALALFGKIPEAVAELKKAVELEPFYARPYAMLAQVLEQAADGPGAMAAYNQYLALASRQDPDRANMTRRRAELAETMGIDLKKQ